MVLVHMVCMVYGCSICRDNEPRMPRLIYIIYCGKTKGTKERATYEYAEKSATCVGSHTSYTTLESDAELIAICEIPKWPRRNRYRCLYRHTGRVYSDIIFILRGR